MAPASTDPTLADDEGATNPGPSRDVVRDPALPAVERGRTVGRYIVVDLLGAGAMGQVYRAYDPDLDRALALKVVGDDAGGATAGSRERARLLREAQAMARISHPNVIQVFDVGELDDSVYVAMELVDGSTLKAWLKTKRTTNAVLDIFEAAGRGLAAAHARGLIHRDFKPDNVMIDGAGKPRVLDFGLARAAHRPSVEAESSSPRAEVASSIDASMTEAGTLLGTPAYMSPEQYRGDIADHRSDQFAFCVALFEGLVGRRPFPGDTVAALAASVTHGKVDLPRDLAVSRGIMQTVLRGLEVDPEARHPSMDALLATLHRQRAKPRNLGMLAGGAALVVGAVVISRGVAPATATVCQGAAHDASEVWANARRFRIADRFEAEAGARGARIWADVATRIDRYAAQWSDARTQACQATRIRGEQSESLLDVRIACFDAQLRELDAMLAALETADAIAIDQSPDAIAALPSSEMCGRVERLLATVPRPTDPLALESLSAIEARQAVIDAEISLGHSDTALNPARALVADAAALGYAPARRAAWASLGAAESKAGTDLAAADAFEEALRAAIEADDAEAAAMAANDLARATGYLMADTERGLRAVALARAFARRAPNGAELETIATSHEASILVRSGDMSRALELQTEVRDFWARQEGGRRHVAGALLDIAATSITIGRARDAVVALERAVELREAEYGADHPSTADALRELGNGLSTLERFDDAETNLRRALTIQQGARGRNSRSVAVLLDDLGRVMRARGDLDGAIASHRQAYEILEAVHGGPNPSLVVSGLNIGYTLNAAGRWDEALHEFVKALELSEAVSGPRHPHIVYAANAAASALVDQHRYDDAYPYAEKALGLEGKAEVPPTLFAEARFIATHALWKDGDVPDTTKQYARALAREAREIYADGPPQWGPYIDKIDIWLAEHG